MRTFQIILFCLFILSSSANVKSDEKLDDKISKLIEKLASDDWETRENATQELVNIGRPAEAQIAKASNTPNSQVVDAARIDVYSKKSIKYRQIYMVSLLLGLAFPFAGIYLNDLLKDKIMLCRKRRCFHNKIRRL